jgi:hypothetical protein
MGTWFIIIERLVGKRAKVENLSFEKIAFEVRKGNTLAHELVYKNSCNSVKKGSINMILSVFDAEQYC